MLVGEFLPNDLELGGERTTEVSIYNLEYILLVVPLLSRLVSCGKWMHSEPGSIRQLAISTACDVGHDPTEVYKCRTCLWEVRAWFGTRRLTTEAEQSRRRYKQVTKERLKQVITDARNNEDSDLYLDPTPIEAIPSCLRHCHNGNETRPKRLKVNLKTSRCHC